MPSAAGSPLPVARSPLSERLRLTRGEQIVGDMQLYGCIQPPAPAAKPLAVEEGCDLGGRQALANRRATRASWAESSLSGSMVHVRIRSPVARSSSRHGSLTIWHLRRREAVRETLGGCRRRAATIPAPRPAHPRAVAGAEPSRTRSNYSAR